VVQARFYVQQSGERKVRPEALLQNVLVVGWVVADADFGVGIADAKLHGSVKRSEVVAPCRRGNLAVLRDADHSERGAVDLACNVDDAELHAAHAVGNVDDAELQAVHFLAHVGARGQRGAVDSAEQVDSAADRHAVELARDVGGRCE
jgi:hypothetical protein